MKVQITAPRFGGSLRVPSSKSMTHRELIAAALAPGQSRVSGVSPSEDIRATVSILTLLGAGFEMEKNPDGTETILVRGGLAPQGKAVLADAGESGSTLRFLIPIGLVSGNEVTYTGHGKLPSRPLTPYLDLFQEKQISCRTEGGLPLTAAGTLRGGDYALPGNVSSQFFTGLLFALPLAEGDSVLRSTTPLESEGYVDMTVDTLTRHGIAIGMPEKGVFAIPGGQTYRAGDFSVEGDYSQAAFWLAAALTGGEMTLEGLSPSSRQGDREIVEILRKMGGSIRRDGDTVTAEKSATHGTVIDAENVPDLVPVLAALAAVSEGTTEIIHAARVRLKECDRLHAMTAELKKLGADIEEKPDGLIIRGKESLSGGTVDSWNDHRIAMALAAVSAKCTGSLVIEGAEAVRKSYPRFWEDFQAAAPGSLTGI